MPKYTITFHPGGCCHTFAARSAAEALRKASANGLGESVVTDRFGREIDLETLAQIAAADHKRDDVKDGS